MWDSMRSASACRVVFDNLINKGEMPVHHRHRGVAGHGDFGERQRTIRASIAASSLTG